MRKISVVLDSSAAKAMEKLQRINIATISDIVNAAVVAFCNSENPILWIEHTTYQKLKDLLLGQHNTVDNWCAQRSIDKRRLQYVCKKWDEGNTTIRGYGNLVQKKRDREDDRLFKTHTAWIAHCLCEEFPSIFSEASVS